MLSQLVANAEPGGGALRVVIPALNAVVRPLTRRAWRGQEKLPSTGGVIIVANHISNVDPLALGQFLAYSGRWPRFLAKASLFEIPVLGRLLRACGQIPVERHGKASREALAAAKEAIAAGRAVVIYPEGTISHDPALWPMRGKTGVTRLALETGCPVVPVGQWGAQSIMYGHQITVPHLLPRPTLQMVVGDPVALDDLRGQPVTAALLAEATERIMAALSALVAELRGETAPVTRFDPRTTKAAPE